MVISPDSLNRHLTLMKSLGATFVALDQWLDKAQQGADLPRLAVAVTFDDGWQDNYQHAYPILKQHAVPATIFLVSRRINTDWQFWPEQVLNLLVNHADLLEHPALTWLSKEVDACGYKRQSALSIEQADAVIARLKSFTDEQIEGPLQEAREAIPALAELPRSRHLLNDQEMQEMQASGLVTYGAHTQHHYRLNRLSDSEQLRREIVVCQEDLKAKGLNTLPVFCYPNGDISQKGEELVKEHYRAACTTARGWNHSPAQPYGLRRFNFHDGNGGNALTFLATMGRPA
ncbi:chitin deacetylase [Marinobacter nanhaiticus D15-8W]|uniref:Chitin deacetylase n=2 Tax=Marinobacter TaxID=2742 RepID=N6WTE4_9GAMM|nr:chitin deacetylase [Marinobacter nanhaiticus D15-8W]